MINPEPNNDVQNTIPHSPPLEMLLVDFVCLHVRSYANGLIPSLCVSWESTSSQNKWLQFVASHFFLIAKFLFILSLEPSVHRGTRHSFYICRQIALIPFNFSILVFTRCANKRRLSSWRREPFKCHLKIAKS